MVLKSADFIRILRDTFLVCILRVLVNYGIRNKNGVCIYDIELYLTFYNFAFFEKGYD
jgi:hypothetical protein